ncbi:MAG: efflux RND transporter periplasmic adaptor subunit [Phycisphaerales bacterium]|nr:efflux RND transporter periplasmic adaptor subunit [Planctomycetota bacterium]
MRKLIVWLLVLGVFGAGGAYAWQVYRGRTKADASVFRTAAVRRTDIVSSISATGTIVPEDVVDIGAQVNGLIASFGNGKDGKPVDYRSEVDAGMVLANIDDALFKADVSTAEAQLAQARAQVLVAEANRAQSQAKLDQAERDWGRAQKLGQSKAISQADYDAAKSAYEQGTANIALSEASIAQAKAAVAIAEASLLRARRNLAYCTIVSPVSGVVIDRRVEIGQTVVASLNAPSLFLLAKDLTKMKVLVQVNEADIGHVIPGHPVTFTVDAFPGATFRGEVRKVRLNATMTQNVVTYTAEIVTDNPDKKLLPYLTANVRFVVDEVKNTLAVPNAALRWAPSAATLPVTNAGAAAGSSSTPGAPPGGTANAGAPAGGPGQTPAGSGGTQAGEQGRARNGQRRGGAAGGREQSVQVENATRSERAAERKGTVWILEEGGVRPVEVQVGISDGLMTAIEGEELKEGDQVVVGEVVAGSASSGTTNPFAPANPFGGRPGGGGGRGR